MLTFLHRRFYLFVKLWFILNNRRWKKLSWHKGILPAPSYGRVDRFCSVPMTYGFTVYPGSPHVLCVTPPISSTYLTRSTRFDNRYGFRGQRSILPAVTVVKREMQRILNYPWVFWARRVSSYVARCYPCRDISLFLECFIFISFLIAIYCVSFGKGLIFNDTFGSVSQTREHKTRISLGMLTKKKTGFG